jgi:hypothetical protein
LGGAERLGRGLDLRILGSIAKPFRAEDMLAQFARLVPSRQRVLGEA